MLDESKRLTLYIYYKIPAIDQAKFLMMVKNLNNQVAEFYPHLKIRHEKRLELDAEKRELWMEVYQNINPHDIEKFSTNLSSLAEQLGLPKERKCERFVSV